MKNCPKCGIPLSLGAYEGFRALRCETCHGHLVGLVELASIQRVTLKSQDELTAEFNTEFYGSTTARVACPRCRAAMSKQAIGNPDLGVQMDVCRACALAWFEAGELALAQLAHEASAGFANAQELKRRMAELDASPARKAAFEQNLARLPHAPDPVADTVSEVLEEAIGREILRRRL